MPCATEPDTVHPLHRHCTPHITVHHPHTPQPNIDRARAVSIYTCCDPPKSLRPDISRLGRFTFELRRFPWLSNIGNFCPKPGNHRPRVGPFHGCWHPLFFLPLSFRLMVQAPELTIFLEQTADKTLLTAPTNANCLFLLLSTK